MDINDAIMQSIVTDVTCPSPGCYAASFTFSTAFPGFRGHFPGQPILPGVCLLQTALVLFSTGCNKKLQLANVKQLKLFRTVLPGEQIDCKATDSGAEIHRGEEKVMLARWELQ